jgi:putative peptidoglycan lipid II flippase
VLCGAVRLMLFATLAAQVCLTVAGFEAVYLIWGVFASRFSVADAEATGTILAFLCLGLSGWAAQTVISRGFYALGSTWVPTIVGTAVAFAAVPLYIVLQRHWGTIGLAIASSISITAYVLFLGFLQRRRFEREAAQRGTSLHGGPGMLNTALRLAAAAAIAIVIGLAVRFALLKWLPGVSLPAIFLRAAVLCAIGGGVYIVLAQLFGIRELATFERMLLRCLKLRQPKLRHVSDAPSH